MGGARKIFVIDSHTGGEPTRVVISGGPELRGNTIAERLESFRKDHDRFRSAIVNEPRGSDAMVGALLCEPSDKRCAAGVIFFNNVGYLGMCGHGMIGLIVTLAHLGKIRPGENLIETPVGIVSAKLNDDGSVSVENVPSYRKTKGVSVSIDGPTGPQAITGDVAWGGNWFFLVAMKDTAIDLANLESLTSLTWNIRKAINAHGYPEVDHVELFSSRRPQADARNFVLCPGKAYDRSPCGTGTSAKLACLAADGKLREGETWIQESVIGSLFKGTFRWADRERGIIIPTITGNAYIDAEATLILRDDDPFCWGIR
jgi:4-hydroxyproline epimerase